MFMGIFILLLATFKLAATDKCERIDWLQPFSNASEFFCYSNGWFPDKTDYDCRRYFVCIKNSENFIRIYLSCPVGTYFNPHVISCTKDYVCPYHLTTTTTATTNRTTTEEMHQSRFSNLCLYRTNLNHFKCKTSGRFPNYNDLTCGSYFHCINVIFPILILKTKLNCGPATYFNPDTKLCEIDYVCPCNNNLTTNNGDSLYSDTTMSLSPAIIESTTMYQPSVVSTTNTETVAKRTSYYITESTSIDECSFNSDPNYFTCTVKGRFRNANDKTCQTYFLCNILSSGRVIQTKYSCPTNSYFNPEKQLCDADYDCPCSSSETTTTEAITTQDMTEITTESLKTDIIEGTTAEIITEDDIKTTIGNTTESTSTLKVSTETTSIDECSFNSDPNYFTCTVKGRFRNANDKTCQTYFWCYILSSGRVIQTKYSCPTNSYFNPEKQLCDADYDCPCSSSETTTTEAITTQEMTEITTERVKTDIIEGTTEEIITEDDDIKTTIGNSTESTSTLGVSTDTTSIDECSFNSDPNYFTCTVKGRFRNANDKTCQTYFWCYILSSGRVIQTKYSCPTNSYFNPEKQLCDADYDCPCSSSETTTTEAITTQEMTEITTERVKTDIIEGTTEEMITEDDDIKTTIGNSTESTSTLGVSTDTTSIDECSFNSDPNYFTCTVKGRFRNANDKTCQTYFLCNILSSGRVIQTKYSCPTNSYFNPEKQLCDADYDCPCSSSETTTTEAMTTQEMTEITTERVKTDIIEGTTEEMITEDDDIKTTIGNSTESTSTLGVSTDTTSIDECSFNSDPNYFTCTVQGRFRNANDKTCQTYFWCYILSSGRVIQTKYSCPTNSYFNPEKQLCDADYDCPCSSSETTTTEAITTQEMTEITTERVKTDIIEGTTEEIITEDDDIKTTIGNSTESTSTLGVSTDTTSIDECSFNSDPNYFTCTVQGRFRNANDKTCQTYFLCNILSSGRVIQTKYSCPTNSYFNPEKQLCDADYDCPCSSSETTTTEAITTQEMTEITTERVKTDIIEGTTEEMITEDDDIKTTIGNSTESTSTLGVSTDTTSIDECSFNSDPNYFTCTVKGRFRNANDKTCQTYFLCNILSSGRVIQTKYSCPTNSYFNPEKQLCDADYDCPCSSSETTTTEAITTQEMTEITTERVKTDIIEGTTEEMITEDDDIKTTIGNSTESTSTLGVSTDTTSIDECSFNSDPNYFTCTVQGRFRNANDKTCQTYFLCNILSSGRVIQTKYSCPTNSYFNPEKQLCDADYDCPCSSSETTTTEAMTTQEMTEITTERVKTDIIEGTTEEMITEDDDIKTTIGNSTESTSTLGVSTDTTSIDECSFNSDPNYFTCTVQGRFRNANDKTCQTYFLCNILSSGRVIQTKYSCPTNSYFNPEKQLCDADYDCPCSSSETTTTEAITTQEMTEITTERVKTDIIEGTTEEMITEDDDIKTTIGNSTESTSTLGVSTDTTSIDECSFNSDPNYFTCTVKGRFRNANDKTCQTYFWCYILSSGRVIQTKYSCPTNSYFNPEKQLCDADYDCPCSSSETTTTEAITTQEMTEITTERVKTDIIEGTTEEIITEDDDIKTTIGNSTESTSTLGVSTDTTSIDECSFNSDPNYFTCTVQGRFRNANDKTCQTYFLCNILSSGRVIQTKYSCPTNSYFNPEKQLCDADYDCPCSSSETTTTEAITTQEMTEITTERVKTDIIEGTTEEMITEDDDIKTTIGNSTESTSTLGVSTDTTSIDECSFNSDPNYFTCTVKGRFRNANDKTCQTYFLCNILSSGRVIQTKYSCPTNSYFNPEKQLCDADYDCPCSSSETTTTEAITTQEMTEITTERVKTDIIEGTTEEMITEDDDIKTTIGNSTESTSTLGVSTDTTSIDECSFNSDPNYFTCTVKGRFRNANDKTCQTYFWCYILSSGRVIQTKYSCPTNSYFNPEKQLCDADYDCPCSSSETTTTEAITTQEMTEITTERMMISKLQ
ncbi:serine-rich adhesin for platelets-like [Diorhabda carinulata]|uniref:serine-rich adhesin for platelets-like n=1 Tax=Diorhabda carinulata TaxID=1163345 RepID=UPI0025A08910|nr:serine-rich adhesin for platelets-like [Diorhabda carinulata]